MAESDLYTGASVIGASATWTAPPASRAVPATVALSFARANFTDMS
ncbi:MAG: hypothetical protein ABJI01_08965 [Alteripontixanthobacter sp.]